MNNKIKDRTYQQIVDHILNNEEFNQIKRIEHHGVTRYEHSLKVSYYSYKIAKALHLNYEEVARGGLLHDFFMSNEDRDSKERIVSTFNHPKKAVQNATRVFQVNDLEADIIKTHMFPINASVPTYAESWVVNLVDKGIGGFELGKKFVYRFRYALNLYVLFLLNSIK